jgi:hypothetical protein
MIVFSVMFMIALVTDSVIFMMALVKIMSVISMIALMTVMYHDALDD